MLSVVEALAMCELIDVGRIGYARALALQTDMVERRKRGEIPDHLLILEHPHVITMGRNGHMDNVLASPDVLQRAGIESHHTNRGGDVTFHGPGQIVAYPIVRLNDHGLSVGGFVRRLEEIVIATLKSFSIPAQKDDCAIGVWTPNKQGQLAKICALGVRIRRGVSLHGIALNVATDLSYFKLIIPCGLPGRAVTSLKELLGDQAPAIDIVKQQLADQFIAAFSSRGGKSVSSAPR